MAITAIDHGRRVVTVTSQCVKPCCSEVASHRMAFMTCIFGGSLNGSSWPAESWADSLRNHATAVRRVIEAIASDVDPFE
jgi:hypothetical protein